MQIFSDISLWWIVPIMTISFLVSFLFYRNQKQVQEVSTLIKTILIALRTASISLLLIFLLGLIIEHKDYKTEKPVFISLIDNSSSMLNYKDSNSVKSSIIQFQKELKEKYKDKFDFQELEIGSEVSSDKLTFSSEESNLDKGFDYIYNLYYNKNVGGIAFFSDGNFTSGMNPIYTAEKINLTPVFSVGIGDTVVKRDQFIRNVAVNDIAFFKNNFPIEIDIEARKMGVSNGVVSIWKNGEKIKEEKIEYKDGYLDFTHVSFEVEANEIGFVEYLVKINDAENESSYENNRRRFYVEIIDSRNKILILADAPHPDLSAIRQELKTDENVEVDSKLLRDWDGSLKDYSLLLLHNPNSMSQKLLTDIVNSKISVLHFVTAQTKTSVASQLKLGLAYPNGNRSDEVQGDVSSSFQLFEISDDLKASLKKWPPLTVKFGKIKSNSGNVLIHQKIGTIKKSDPVLYFGKNSKMKYGVFVGEGLWRWRLFDYANNKNTTRFNELIQKTVQYLTVKKNSDPLRINLPNRVTTNDDITLNAEFYNSSFERITEPTISLVLMDREGIKVNYEFAKNSKDYVLSLGKLPEGKYEWKASAEFDRSNDRAGGKRFEKSGVFVVDDVSKEAMNSYANHNLLQQIANKTNGQFYELNKVSNLLNDLDQRKDLVSISYQESSFDDLIDWKWLFFLVIVLLGTEWFIRRYSGDY
tara:strand:+ start:6719 stop:8812 length:2094 start_codon:yes stop_codon:yes gene_type:complete